MREGGRDGGRESESESRRSSEVHPDPAGSSLSEADLENNPRCSGRCSGDLPQVKP